MKILAALFTLLSISLSVSIASHADSSPKISICNSNGYEYPIYREEPKRATCYFSFFGETAYGTITRIVHADKVTICRTPNTKCVGRRTKQLANECACSTPFGIDRGHYVEIVK